MSDKSNELVHAMPTNSRVKLTFTRVDMKRIENGTVFTYQLDNWNSENGEAPTFTCQINDWDGDDPADRGILHRAVQIALSTGIEKVMIDKFGKK